MIQGGVPWWQEWAHWAPYARVAKYLRTVGLYEQERPKLTKGQPEIAQRTHWAELLVLQAHGYRSAAGRTGWVRACTKFGRAVKREPDLGPALEASFRLGGVMAAKALVQDVIERAKPKPSAEELAAKREQARKKTVQRRHGDALAKLAEHERRLKMEERLVRKWRRKVAYYARKGVTPDG